MNKLWSDVENAEFTLAVRGYDRGEVDDFIDRTARAVRDVEEQNSALHAKLKTLETDLAATREKASSVEHAFLDAVEHKQRLLAEAEQEAIEILAAAESHVGSVDSAEGSVRREAARKMLEEAAAVLAAAKEESVRIRSAAVADGEAVLEDLRRDAVAMRATAQVEADSIVAGARHRRDQLVAALRLLQEAVREMLETGARDHEAIRVILTETVETASSDPTVAMVQ